MLFRCGQTMPPARFAGLPSERKMLRRRDGLLAIAAVLDGASREEAAKIGGMDRQTRIKHAVSILELCDEHAHKQEILRRLGSRQLDVVHYAGLFDLINPSKSGILCAGEEVLSEVDLVNLGSLPSLAFLNACESGRVRRGTKRWTKT